jgi:hypothetical protein
MGLRYWTPAVANGPFNVLLISFVVFEAASEVICGTCIILRRSLWKKSPADIQGSEWRAQSTIYIQVPNLVCASERTSAYQFILPFSVELSNYQMSLSPSQFPELANHLKHCPIPHT